MIPALTHLPLSATGLRHPLVETDIRLRKRIKNAYKSVHKHIVEDTHLFNHDDAKVITACIEWLNNEVRTHRHGAFDDYLLDQIQVARALLHLIDALEAGQPIDREIEAYGTVLASFLITTPSSLVNYTSAYQSIESDGYTFDKQAVASQDALVEACLVALSKQPIDQRERRSGFHGHDASLRRTPATSLERAKWWVVDERYPKTTPVPLRVPMRCSVYTCGDRPEPFPSVGDLLYADDSLIWTHQSRFWSYPCWGKHWSLASKNRNASMCTRFVITLEQNNQIQCFPMDMSGHFEMEVHIIEAPLHLGACLDSLVLYDANGITLRVTQVIDNIAGENYSSEIHCHLL